MLFDLVIQSCCVPMRMDPGAILRDLVLHCPIAAQDMRHLPLPKPLEEPLGYHFLAMALAALLLAVVPAEQMPNYS